MLVGPLVELQFQLLVELEYVKLFRQSCSRVT
jgi:hypothetical protein